MLFLILGFIAGVLSGLIGIGGGVVLIPGLVYIFGFSQHQAQGTTLAAMVPPIGILAAIIYYKKGYVNLPIVLFICLGFFIGGMLGALLAINIPNNLLRKMFGIFLFIVSLHMIFYQ